MKILSVVSEGLRIALRNRSLWLFGFFVGLGSSRSGGGGSGGAASSAGLPGSAAALLLLVMLIVALVIGGLVMRFLSEGALIEGVSRIRQGRSLTTRECFSEGWAHIGPVFLIKLAYFGATVISVLLLALPCLLVVRLMGASAVAFILGIAALLVAVPWLVTLYIWHAFALRIAVLQNRRTADAIRKARLFLHGRLLDGLKLMIATIVGTLLVVLVALVALAPFVLLVAGLAAAFGPVPVVLSLPLFLAAIAIAVAVIGTFQSSVWTVGYLQRVEA